MTATPIRRFSPHFFVLGIAFLLLETKSLVSFSLLFGTTWIVNALAFFAILASVLLAILVNVRLPADGARAPLYVGLFAAIAVAYLVPADALLIDPPELRYVLAGAIAFAPVFFANLVFTYSFRDTDSADMSFASNLLGAMVGGVLEYVALVTGFQPLLVVVGGAVRRGVPAGAALPVPRGPGARRRPDGPARRDTERPRGGRRRVGKRIPSRKTSPPPSRPR